MNDARTLRIGQSLPYEAPRDAIHVAIIPVVLGEDMQPGQHVHIIDGVAVAAPGGHLCEEDCVGVIDPYCNRAQWGGPLTKGARFWLFLNPGSITSLRHEWTHPAFPVAGSE